MKQVETAQPTSCTSIELHPDFPYLKQKVDITLATMKYDLEASRWVSGLLATIMGNAELLKA